MAERVLDRVMAIADRLREQAEDAERLGRLPDETVKDLKSVGAIRLLQPKQYNGFEVHPREFAETVMAVASLDPASGWICGVVGVHPYQLAYADPRVPEEIWGTDTDTWVASPTPRRASPRRSTTATSSTADGSSAPALTPVSGFSWEPWSVTWTASR
jgi:3-hydroxy-9,10-secoandrosta-1,3,5(10)-triene-9,17-dione monooxygenase